VSLWGSRGLQRAWHREARWLVLLWPLSLLYRAVAQLIALSYRLGWRRAWRAPCPVIVVGNIHVGGTGKTPVVIALAQALSVAGWRVGVISRGYGGRRAGQTMTVQPDSDPAAVGDEPLLIRRHTGCPVMVGRDRVAAAQQLLQISELDLIISDDGLQHHRLARDFEIVVVDTLPQTRRQLCLPAGPLRETAARLARVDWLIERDTLGSGFALGDLIRLQDGKRESLSAWRGRPVYGVAGIGRPERFFADLTAAGLQVIPRAFPDHHRFAVEELAALVDAPVVMTEKDAVKCLPFAQPHWWFVELELRLPAGLVTRLQDVLSRNPA
jgi:tetraacyldisaccharide 4'-kinase